PKKERRAAILEISQKTAWVVDGVAQSLRDRADVVIFLDVPPTVRAARGLFRSLRYLTRSRPDSQNDVPNGRSCPGSCRLSSASPERPALRSSMMRCAIVQSIEQLR